MIRFLADESFDGDVITGVRSKHPHVDILTAHEVGLGATPDPEILQWATRSGRVVLSRDVRTMKADAVDMIHQNRPTTGVLLADDRMSRGTIIDQIEIWSRKDLESAFAYPIQYLRPY